jgi:hypothetical protein
MPLPRGIQDARPGGTHTSSPDGASDFSEHFLTGNWLHAAGTNVIPPQNCLGRPSPLDLVSFAHIEALDHFLREQGPRSRRKLHCLVGDLI